MAAATARNPHVAYDAEQAEAALANVQKRRQQWRASNAPETKRIKQWNEAGEKLKRQRDETFDPGSVDGTLQKRGDDVYVQTREFQAMPICQFGRKRYKYSFSDVRVRHLQSGGFDGRKDPRSAAPGCRR